MFYDIRRNLGFTNRTTCAIQVTHIKEEKKVKVQLKMQLSLSWSTFEIYTLKCVFISCKNQKNENMGWTIKINFEPWVYFFQCIPNDYLFWMRKYTRWYFSLVFISNFRNTYLTEPRWALQPQGTQQFPWIGLFVV